MLGVECYMLNYVTFNMNNFLFSMKQSQINSFNFRLLSLDWQIHRTRRSGFANPDRAEKIQHVCLRLLKTIMQQESLTREHAREIASGQRFAFGKNWENFVKRVDRAGLEAARNSLTNMLERSDLQHLDFLDIGSGSGLFSLAARSLGAKVYSFDYDPQSIASTLALKQQYFENDTAWQVEQGTVLDPKYLAQLRQFDIVYAWGMLHQTGDMWQAFDNIIPLVKDEGMLFISIYNDQGWKSRYWKCVKRWYNRHPVAKLTIIAAHLPLLIARIAVRTLSGRLKLKRGMSLWHDYLDWLGGYPFEVARPEDILDFSLKRGLMLQKLKTCGGRSGCNEYVFRKIEG